MLKLSFFYLQKTQKAFLRFSRVGAVMKTSSLFFLPKETSIFIPYGRCLENACRHKMRMVVRKICKFYSWSHAAYRSNFLKLVNILDRACCLCVLYDKLDWMPCVPCFCDGVRTTFSLLFNTNQKVVLDDRIVLM